MRMARSCYLRFKLHKTAQIISRNSIFLSKCFKTAVSEVVEKFKELGYLHSCI